MTALPFCWAKSWAIACKSLAPMLFNSKPFTARSEEAANDFHERSVCETPPPVLETPLTLKFMVSLSHCMLVMFDQGVVRASSLRPSMRARGFLEATADCRD